MCITVQSAPAHTHSILTALIFALTAAADQAVYAAGVEWIGSHASESDRPVLTGFSSAARAGATAIVGIGIGAIATQLQTIWPVVIVLALSALAVVAASRTPARLAI